MAMTNALPPVGLQYEKLVEEFKKVCPDFCHLNPNAKSQSLSFAAKVLFELGPKMRALKQSGKDEMWCMDFKTSDAISKSVFIYSYRFRKPINVQPIVLDNKIYLSLKQAALLATDVLCRTTPKELKPKDKFVLTPLARAVFTLQSIPKIALDLSRLFGRPVNISEVLKTIISSCQTDGFHLECSACHVALVALNASVNDIDLQKRLRAKAIRIYKKHGKEFDGNQYEIYARHSKLPTEYDSKVEELFTELSINSDPKNDTADNSKQIACVIDKIFRRIDNPLSGTTVDISPTDFASLRQTFTKKEVTAENKQTTELPTSSKKSSNEEKSLKKATKCDATTTQKPKLNLPFSSFSDYLYEDDFGDLPCSLNFDFDF